MFNPGGMVMSGPLVYNIVMSGPVVNQVLGLKKKAVRYFLQSGGYDPTQDEGANVAETTQLMPSVEGI